MGRKIVPPEPKILSRKKRTKSNANEKVERGRKNSEENTKEVNKTIKNNSKKRKSVTFSSDTVDNEVQIEESPKKKKKQKLKEATEEETESSGTLQKKPGVLSKRAQKRQKREMLLATEKLKSTIKWQQNSVNYLSRWKHSRSEWKFDKSTQIWLQKHFFDSKLVPDEYWDCLMEYFNNGQGNMRKSLIDQCVKIIEESENDEESCDETKINRARTLVQRLEE